MVCALEGRRLRPRSLGGKEVDGTGSPGSPWGIWGPVLGAGGGGSGAPGPDPISSGGGPRVPTRAEILIDRMHVPIDLAAVSCSGRLRRELPWAIHAGRLLDRVGFGRAHPCFSLTVWFQRERCEALLAVTIMGYAFSFHGEVSWRRRSWKLRSED